jgi:MFS family permease
MYGHRNLYMLGFIWYALWSVIAGVSVYSSSILFIVSRAFQGIGCALLVPNALALVGRTYGASPRKNMILALFGAAAPTGTRTAGMVAVGILRAGHHLHFHGLGCLDDHT